MIGLLLSCALIGCPEDCSKVLVAKDKPYVQEQVYKVEKKVKPEDPQVKKCVDMEDGSGCKPMRNDEKSGFYSIVTFSDI